MNRRSRCVKPLRESPDGATGLGERLDRSSDSKSIEDGDNERDGKDLGDPPSESYTAPCTDSRHGLARVVAAWPQLPDHIKAAIVTLVDATDQKSE